VAERFEELIAWQKARILTRSIYGVTKDGPFVRDFSLCSQLQRASVSVMSNIAEGVERYGPNELPHFLSMAKGSCAEVRSQLYVALDVGYITQSQFDDLYEKVNEVGRLVGGLRMSTISRKQDK
jgi:four helix bundle protein